MLTLIGRLRFGPIREVVFGVEDGVVQNVTLVAAMVGGGLSNNVILFAGSVNAVAGVLSMSMGTYLSSKAEREVEAALHRDGAQTTEDRTPQRDAAVMAAAYASGAAVPLVPFAIGGGWAALLAAVALTSIALFALGVGKAIASDQRRVRSGIEMLTLASTAGLLGYLVGVAARAIFGLDF